MRHPTIKERSIPNKPNHRAIHLKTYCGYIRVSTARQGEHSVSLPEQKAVIERYARQFNLHVSEWFEERQTAAKRGRPVWAKMLKLLRGGTLSGVLMHKIDRSARNLKDWADLGELIDGGVEVHFANESLDLTSRGGRLSADIQAVIAADYIRNLREEAKKGIYGRLKQGFYPLAAPVGYLDHGGGKSKTIDPEKGPLVRRAFELYSTGRYTIATLGEELSRLGLRNRAGGRVTRNGLSTLLNNPFYVGIVRIRKTGQIFQGNHEPLITKRLFDEVQDALKGRFHRRTLRHAFLFRKYVRCKGCGYSLIGEAKKGHIYYRCHTKDCPMTGVREEKIAIVIATELRKLRFSEGEKEVLSELLKEQVTGWADRRAQDRAALIARREQLAERTHRLTDAYVDGLLERGVFDERQKALLMERREIEDKLGEVSVDEVHLSEMLKQFIELTDRAYLLYQEAIPEGKRHLLKMLTSNLTADQETLDFAFAIPFNDIANREKCTSGSTSKGLRRILDELVATLLAKPEIFVPLIANLDGCREI